MNDKTLVCPLCDEGSLSEEIYSDTFSYRGRKMLVEGLHKSVCSNCAGEPILPTQIRRDQVRIAEAKGELGA